MKTLYVHIGTPKTGTTSIQRFCMDNESLLNERGYCYPPSFYKYPVVAKARNGHFLVGVIKDENGERCLEREAQLFNEGMEKVQEQFAKYDNVILSDESIWRAMDIESKDLWDKLKEESKKGDFTIKAIVYLRRQDKMICSIWNQSIKSPPGNTDRRFEDYIKDRNLEARLNYGDKIDRLASILGKENLIVRRFDKENFIGGNIYTDFLQAIGLEWEDKYEVGKEDRNTGLAPGNPTEIKRIINTLPKARDLKTQNFFRDVLKDCSEVSKEKYPCDTLSKEETLELLSKYEEGNKKIAREYFGEEELFDNTVKDLPKWTPDNPYMLEDVVRFIGMSNVYLLDEITQLKEENKKLRKEFETLQKEQRSITASCKNILNKFRRK